MKEQIVINLKPTEYKQTIYVFSDTLEEVPATYSLTLDEIPSFVNNTIEQLDISNVRVGGAKAYAEKIVQDLTHSVQAHFGLTKTIKIELF